MFASHLVIFGVDLPTVRKSLSHSDIQSTMNQPTGPGPLGRGGGLAGILAFNVPPGPITDTA